MKKIIILMMMGLALLSMTACGKKKEISVSDVSAKLLSEITYTDELAEIDLETAKMYFIWMMHRSMRLRFMKAVEPQQRRLQYSAAHLQRMQIRL